MVDPRRPEVRFPLGDARQSLDPFWWDEAEPIWVTAEKAGVRTGTMFWPGSEVAIHGTRPQDWLRYDKAVSGTQRINTVLDWMRRPPAMVRMRYMRGQVPCSKPMASGSVADPRQTTIHMAVAVSTPLALRNEVIIFSHVPLHELWSE